MIMFRRLCLASLVVLIRCATTRQTRETEGAPSSTMEVTARLTKIPGKFPADDLYDYAYVMQYQVEGGTMDKQTILVAHYKPRLARAEIDGAMKKVVAGSLKR